MSTLQNKIFLDTSYLVSLFYPGDNMHQEASYLSEKYETSNFYVNMLIIYETIHVLSQKSGKAHANAFIKLIESKKINILVTTSDTWLDAAKIFLAANNKFNLFDHFHFHTIKNYGIKKVLSFDVHFKKQKDFTVLE